MHVAAGAVADLAGNTNEASEPLVVSVRLLEACHQMYNSSAASGPYLLLPGNDAPRVEGQDQVIGCAPLPPGSPPTHDTLTSTPMASLRCSLGLRRTGGWGASCLGFRWISRDIDFTQAPHWHVVAWDWRGGTFLSTPIVLMPCWFESVCLRVHT